MFSPAKSSFKKAFTLIELLVVIAIIAILASILFPVFARARENARKTSCLSNMKQIGVAMGMYTQDYDEYLPEPGLGGVFRNAADNGLGQIFTGVLPFHLAVQPYAKNYQLFGCPSDSKKQNASIDRNTVRDMFIAANVPGATNLPPYGNNSAFHEAVAQIFPNSYGTNYILSQTYQYNKRSDGTVVLSSDDASNGSRGRGRGRSLAEILEPTNTWILTELSSSPSTGNGGWYTTPGYLNANSDVNQRPRWRGGMRHLEGRNWLFVDGHAKWVKDLPYEVNGVATPEATIANYYTNKQIYTTPQ